MVWILVLFYWLILEYSCIYRMYSFTIVLKVWHMNKEVWRSRNYFETNGLWSSQTFGFLGNILSSLHMFSTGYSLHSWNCESSFWAGMVQEVRMRTSYMYLCISYYTSLFNFSLGLWMKGSPSDSTSQVQASRAYLSINLSSLVISLKLEASFNP